ncbi:MAG: cobyric acid synthase [Alphaproteobacteria bacterium]|nr:cobyric acid synthase [Alphaproteobacteria bacterium]
MVQGTGSDVGKSLLVAGLARACVRRGLSVRPFKPQNMSTNAAVTVDGGEIGRAQALQARACGVPPQVDMNPVLLKPDSEQGSQVIVQGKVVTRANARRYTEMKRTLLPQVLESYQRLGAEADLVLVEGAGSASEVNLRAHDIANMGFAEAADLPVLLVGDIDRGGVIASVVGTHVLLAEAERARLVGYVINKMRGDASLFHPALETIKNFTGLDCFGIVPFWPGAARLPPEDSVALAGLQRRVDAPIRIVVPRLPRIANFDDLDPLLAEPDVDVVLVQAGEPLVDADVILLPGSKATLGDLAALRAAGWDIDIAHHLRRRRPVFGICGGYQMLGRTVADPDGLEGAAASVPGLGYLDVETTMAPEKRLAMVTATADGAVLSGYEMHLGVTTGPDCARPFCHVAGRPDGARSRDGLVAGTYLHGAFASDGFRHRFLADLRSNRHATLAFEVEVEAALDGLADHLEQHLAIDRLLAAAGAPCRL